MERFIPTKSYSIVLCNHLEYLLLIIFFEFLINTSKTVLSYNLFSHKIFSPVLGSGFVMMTANGGSVESCWIPSALVTCH